MECPKCKSKNLSENLYHRAIDYFGADKYCNDCHVHINSAKNKAYDQDDILKKWKKE
jgi:RNA polymerase subunit RPABC4/transcription elongation factor Spt4